MSGRVTISGDGKLDLVCVGTVPDQLSLLPGKGDGTFQAAVQTMLPIQGGSLTAVDINEDGKLDLLTLDGQSGALYVLLGNGDGTFQAGVSYATGNRGALSKTSRGLLKG